MFYGNMVKPDREGDGSGEGPNGSKTGTAFSQTEKLDQLGIGLA